MALQADQIADLVQAARPTEIRDKWVDASQKKQKYHALPRLLVQNRTKLSGGLGPRLRVRVKSTATAKFTGLYASDTTNVTDVFQYIQMGWRHATNNWSYDEREPEINSGPDAIFNLVQAREATAMLDLTDLIENAFFTTVPTATDTDQMHGIFYWLVPYSSAAATPTNPGADDFYGLDPYAKNAAEITGGAGGLSSDTYPYWANWAGKYTDVTPDDAIRLMRNAADYTDFEAPVPVPQYDRIEDDWGLYTVHSALASMQTLARQQNESIGFDIGSKAVTFNNRPIEWVRALEAVSGAPIIGLNWSTFEVHHLSDPFVKKTPPLRNKESHNVWNCFVDMSMDTLCCNRRRNWILTTTDVASITYSV